MKFGTNLMKSNNNKLSWSKPDVAQGIDWLAVLKVTFIVVLFNNRSVAEKVVTGDGVGTKGIVVSQ